MIGKPSQYDPKYCDQLIEFMSQGFPLNAFPGEIGVSRSTIYNWINKHDDFREAMELARAKQCRELWGQALKGLWITKEGPNLNQNLWGRIMLNCFPEDWVVSEKKPDELGADDIKALTEAVKTLREIE